MQRNPVVERRQKHLDWAQYGLQSKVWLDMKSCDMCPTDRKHY